jgi:hypothetical protein
MTRSRLMLKVLGTCALVLGLMTAWAGAAQAEETGGKWTYINASGELKTFEGALSEPEVSGELETGTVAILHAKVLGGTSLLVECKSMTAPEGKLKAGGTMLGRLIFNECLIYLNGILSKPCTPIGGSIETLKLKAVMLLHKLASGTVDKILVAEPDETNDLAFILTTEVCAIGEKILIGGKFAIEPTNPTTHEVKHLMKEFPALTHMFVISDTPEHAANILGSALAFLKGVHAGLKWAGLWN